MEGKQLLWLRHSQNGARGSLGVESSFQDNFHKLLLWKTCLLKFPYASSFLSSIWIYINLKWVSNAMFQSLLKCAAHINWNKGYVLNQKHVKNDFTLQFAVLLLIKIMQKVFCHSSWTESLLGGQQKNKLKYLFAEFP